MACILNMACHLRMRNLCGFLLHTQHFLYTLGKQLAHDYIEYCIIYMNDLCYYIIVFKAKL